MIKTDFHKKLTSFNRKTTSNKTKSLEVQKKLNSPITKDYNFFLGRIYFTFNLFYDGSRKAFVYQPTLDYKKTKVLIMLLAGNQMEYIILNLRYYILYSYIA